MGNSLSLAYHTLPLSSMEIPMVISLGNLYYYDCHYPLNMEFITMIIIITILNQC